jgi:MFS family permease
MGYFKHLLPAGSVLIVFGMMMASICDELWQLVLAQGLCVGIGCGLVFVPTIGVVMQWFSSKRALANGLGSIGSGIGE